VVPGEELSGSYLGAVQRGFQFARELGHGCRPVHFLVGIAEGRGPAAAALAAGAGRPLREVVTVAGDIPADSAAYLHGQAQGAAVLMAGSLGQRPASGHLLVALIDQGTDEVLLTLSRAGLDPAAIRRAVLAGSARPPGSQRSVFRRFPRPGPWIGRPFRSPNWTSERGGCWPGGTTTFPWTGCAEPGTGRPCPAWNVTRPRGWPTGSAWMKTSVTR